MSNVGYVMTVYFAKNELVPNWAWITSASTKKFFGLQPWLPKGTLVMQWAVDYVSCSDTRWVIFGPYATVHEAQQAYLQAFKDIPEATLGFHIESADCVTHRFKEKFPCAIWTDG